MPSGSNRQGDSDSSSLAEIRARFAQAASVCVLTGSGISAESGLPTFRGVGGLWRTHRVEDLASAAGFERDPELVWTWYNERRAAHRRAVPNAGHHALSRLEERVADFTLATQNVDSLHLRAGSRNVLELHGSLRSARCNLCGELRPLDEPLDVHDIAHACGGLFRPDIVWFGESLPAQTWVTAVAAAGRADIVLVVGTSGMVNPAALLATHIPQEDAYIIEVNLEATVITERADVYLAGPAAEILPQLLETAHDERGS